MPVRTTDVAVRRHPLAHPARARIVAHLASGATSPSVLAAALGETLGTTAYHVRTLEQSGMLVLDHEERVRGAIEHFYRLGPGVIESLEEITAVFVNARARARRGRVRKAAA